MTEFYIGKCAKCGAINAAALVEYEDGEGLKDMLDSGLLVSKVITAAHPETRSFTRMSPTGPRSRR